MLFTGFFVMLLTTVILLKLEHIISNIWILPDVIFKPVSTTVYRVTHFLSSSYQNNAMSNLFCNRRNLGKDFRDMANSVMLCYVMLCYVSNMPTIRTFVIRHAEATVCIFPHYFLKAIRLPE